MPALERATQLMTWRPLRTGVPAPELSLTADDGTWVRLPDFVGERNVVLLFISRLGEDGSDQALRALNTHLAHLTELDTVVFGISTPRPDKLRAHRHALELAYPLLYDPFAVDSRAFRASSRWRPKCRDAVVVVDKNGRISWTSMAPVDVGALVGHIEGLEGRSSQEESATGGVSDISSEQAVELLESDGKYVLVDVRTQSEYDADHAPWALHIPVDELPQRYGELGQTARVICVCQAGARSAAASEFLLSIGGTEIYNVVGGMSGWSGPRVTGGVAQ